jgi:transposase
VRVTTAFNRVLQLPGANVVSVSFTDAGIVIGVRRTGRRLRCPCGFATRARYDASTRRWRHLDFGASKVWLQAEIRRLDCRRCGRVRTEQVPWARPDARHTRDVEDLAAWLAQRMDKTSVTRLLRCSWEAVDRITKRVVAEHIDDTRLDELYRIGVDEVSYKRGHRYLTVVADHDTGRVVWLGKDRSQQTFHAFFDALGPRAEQVEAITLDASSIYLAVARDRIPNATVCIDPYHVVTWVTEVVDTIYRADPPRTADQAGLPNLTAWRRARFAVRAGAERLTDEHRDILNALRRHRYRLWRAWELKEQLRQLYRSVDPADARAYLKHWITRVKRSRIPAFGNVIRRISKHFDAIVAAIELGLSNSRLEGINAKIRLIQRRGYGIRDLDSLTSMIYLCLGGITITPPTER